MAGSLPWRGMQAVQPGQALSGELTRPHDPTLAAVAASWVAVALSFLALGLLLRVKLTRVMRGIEKGVLRVSDGAQPEVLDSTQMNHPFIDIRRVDQALRLAGERFAELRQVVESVPSAIIMTCPGGNIRLVNRQAEKIFGYSREELLGQPAGMLVPERFRGSQTEGGGLFFHPPAMRSAEAGPDLFGRRKDGAEFPMAIGLNPMDTREGAMVVIVAVDNTELKHAQQRLESATQAAEGATRAKSEFLAQMSHEIRTPMNAILGMADLLWETELDEKQRKYVAVFRRNSTRLLHLINGILDLSRVEAGKRRLSSEPFHLGIILDEAMETMTSAVKRKNLTLDWSVDGDVWPWLTGDPESFQQILLNLVSNAMKFTDQGGISVRVINDAETSGLLRFSVSDSGCGIPAEAASLIFQAFEQGGASTTRKHGGTGLGLAIASSLVELMGGRIWVESAVGQGSIFRFTARFERRPASETGPSSEPAPALALAGATRPRILLVDDSEDNVRLLQAYLEGQPLDLHLAENGQIAVVKRTNRNFDVILMDVQMPVMDGYAATRAIREWERNTGTPPVPILALTAHALVEEGDRSQAAGCTAFLTKPIAKRDLLAVIAKYTARPSAPGETAQVRQLNAAIQALVPSYMASKREDLAKLQQALEAPDFETIRVIGHNIKGSGGGYGFPELSTIGAACESAAKGGDAVEISRQLTALGTFLSAWQAPAGDAVSVPVRAEA